MGDEDATADLRRAVEDQAQARVAGDVARFASYLTPQALLRLHRQGEPLRIGGRAGRFEIIDITLNGDRADSDVRYAGRGSHVLRTRWERRDGVWKAIMVEAPREFMSVPWWGRIFGRGRSAGAPGPDRRDLR